MYQVLIVEDDDLLRRILTRNLVLRGYTVAEAASVVEADDALEASPTPFDLILLDINLPDQTGWDVLRHLETRRGASTISGQRQPKPAVIIMSAVRPPQCRLDQFQPAAALLKPFPIGTLLRLTERVLTPSVRSGAAGTARR